VTTFESRHSRALRHLETTAERLSRDVNSYDNVSIKMSVSTIATLAQTETILRTVAVDVTEDPS
jgi:hypothetical protein